MASLREIPLPKRAQAAAPTCQVWDRVKRHSRSLNQPLTDPVCRGANAVEHMRGDDPVLGIYGREAGHVSSVWCRGVVYLGCQSS